MKATIFLMLFVLAVASARSSYQILVTNVMKTEDGGHQQDFAEMDHAWFPKMLAVATQSRDETTVRLNKDLSCVDWNCAVICFLSGWAHGECADATHCRCWN